MKKILRIEDVKVVDDGGKKIARYVFNDDKIVRVLIPGDRVLTENVQKEYLSLIGNYASVHRDDIYGNSEIEEYDDGEISNDEDAIVTTIGKKEFIARIERGGGVGMGIVAGCLAHITIVIPLILAFTVVGGGLDYLSNENDLMEKDPESVNFDRGFWGTCIFGLIVGIFCCVQWKGDIIDALKRIPNRINKNRHYCFEIWTRIFVLFNLVSIMFVIILGMLGSFK